MKNILIILSLLSCGICFGQRNLKSKTLETSCDSIYMDKNYKIVQEQYPEGIETNNYNNTIFQLIDVSKAKSQTIFQDSIYSRTGVIEFKDFNNDGIKDILVQNESDARSNWTYYLYLVDTANNQLKRIQGFEVIKNPNFLPKYNIIDNYVNSGQNWTSFYKIKNDKIIDYDIIIFDDFNDGEIYKSAYKQAIQEILIKEKTSR